MVITGILVTTVTTNMSQTKKYLEEGEQSNHIRKNPKENL